MQLLAGDGNFPYVDSNNPVFQDHPAVTGVTWFGERRVGTLEAVETVVPSAMAKARDLIEEWRGQTAAQAVFSASRVQDRLFDLYGEVSEGPAVEVVERWLLLTRERQMLTASELDELLEEVAAHLATADA